MKFIKVAPDRYINVASIKEIVLTSNGAPHSPVSRQGDETWSAMVIFIDGKREPFIGPAALNFKNLVQA
jgi:hypothetical protein